MNKPELKVRALKFFELYPTREKLYATADGNFFLDKSPALSHSRSAKIECYEFDKNEEPKGAEETSKDDLMKKVLSLNADTAKYPEMKSLLMGLNLQPESWKKEDVISSIKAIQTSNTNKGEESTAPGSEEGNTTEETDTTLNQ